MERVITIVFKADEVDDFLPTLMQKDSEEVEASCWIDITLTDVIMRQGSREEEVAKDCLRRGTGGTCAWVLLDGATITLEAFDCWWCNNCWLWWLAAAAGLGAATTFLRWIGGSLLRRST